MSGMLAHALPGSAAHGQAKLLSRSACTYRALADASVLPAAVPDSIYVDTVVVGADR